MQMVGIKIDSRGGWSGGEHYVEEERIGSLGLEKEIKMKEKAEKEWEEGNLRQTARSLKWGLKENLFPLWLVTYLMFQDDYLEALIEGTIRSNKIFTTCKQRY